MSGENPTPNAYPRADLGASSGQVSFPELERRVLDYWAADDTFRASIENRSDAAEFVFYDGPPSPMGCRITATC